MMALDARQSREGDLKVAPAPVRLETMDAQWHARWSTGTAPVEADGSFFVKVPADKPIRFALLDAKGAVVRQEHGWFWIRRGEQRYLRGLPYGAGARIGESRARGAAAHDHGIGCDRREWRATRNAGRQLK